MKHLAILTLIALAALSPLRAADSHSHDKPLAAPQGGRLIEIDNTHAEFLILPDRKVSVTFYDHDMKPLAPSSQLVTLIAEAPSGRATLDFEPAASAFLSRSPLPEGNGYRLVLRIRNSPDSTPRNFRFDLHTEPCSACKLPEYACTCPPSAGHAH